MKVGELITKLAGTGLLCMSVLFLIGFTNVGAGSPYFVSALACGAPGLWLITRRGARSDASPELAARVDQLERALETTQQGLGAAQDELKQLTEEREFYRALHAPAPRVTQ